MTDAYERLLKLRAVRAYEERRLAEEDLERILDAGRWTGSSKNRQSWSFVVITDRVRKAKLADAGRFSDPVRNAPVAVALVQEPEGYEFDTGRLAQNMMLAADALGIASCPITLHDEAQAAKVLGLPAGARCRYAIALGYPASAPSKSPYGGRRPLGELVHYDHYGS